MADFTFAPLSPNSLLQRSARAFPERMAVIDGDLRLTYTEFADRCGRVTSALAAAGVQRGDRVAALCTNSHVMLELHQAVPARGAVLVPINTRLSFAEMQYIIGHSGARMLVATQEFDARARELAADLGIDAVVAGGEGDDYEAWLPAVPFPEDEVQVDERDLLAINYTSGTTGHPKGVMYHHRGAYLQAVAMAYHTRLAPSTGYLWTLPMFHCNGWCFTWAVGAAGEPTSACARSTPATSGRRCMAAPSPISAPPRPCSP